MARSNDGRYLEDAVEIEFKKIKKSVFHWRRLYDTKSARDYLPAQPADYFLCDRREPAHLECKSQKGKTRRLKKFTQLPAMRRWATAGVDGYVLVHFWDLDEIWLVDVENLDPEKPSWVMKDVHGQQFSSIKEALYAIVDY